MCIMHIADYVIIVQFILYRRFYSSATKRQQHFTVCGRGYRPTQIQRR